MINTFQRKKALDERRLGLKNQWAELMRTESILLQIMHAVQKEMGGAPLNLKNLEKWIPIRMSLSI